MPKTRSQRNPPNSPELIAMTEDRDFWRRMALRSRCGCVYADCSLHGSYVPSDIERWEEETRKEIDDANRRMEQIRGASRWVLNNNRKAVRVDLE